MGDFDERIARLLEPGTGSPPLTDVMVAEARARLGVDLPDDLLALLRVQNGGSVRAEFTACRAPRPTSHLTDGIAPVDHLRGIAPRSTTSLLQSPDLNATWEQPRDLVLLAGDGHWWIALDYRAAGRRWRRRREPPVIFYDNDTEPHEEVVLAPSFRAFVERLEPAPEVDLDLPDPEWREHMASLTHLLDPPYRALGDDAVLAEVRAELADFAHRVDARFSTRVEPAEAGARLAEASATTRVVLFHPDRDPFGEAMDLQSAVAAVLDGGGLVSCMPARLALYVDARGADALILRRDL